MSAQPGDPEMTRDNMGAVPALSVRELSKTFPGTQALSSVSLQVARGEVRALLGENGSGKSTLIKILSGYHEPDGGVVEIGGDSLRFANPSASHEIGARFVHQDLGLVDGASVLDNFAFTNGFPTRWGTIRGRRAGVTVGEALTRVGLDIDPRTPVGRLGAAERTGVAVARALHSGVESGARLLVLDEPTATLPGSEVADLLRIVRTVADQGTAVLYVTHRLDEVFAVATTATVLRDGREVITTDVANLTRAELLNHLVGTELEEAHLESAAIGPAADAQALLDVRGLYAGRLVDVSFSLRHGEVVGISGVTGSGREDVTRAVFGALRRDAGTVRIGGRDLADQSPGDAIRRGAAYLPPDRKRLGGMMDLSARENLTVGRLDAFWRWPMLRRREEAAEARTWFEKLDVHPAGGLEQRLSTFSGGNQQKILLAKWLRMKPKVLLLDEPTQGVDVGSRATIHSHLLAAAADGAGVLMSSVDVDELVALCHRVLVIRDGRLVDELSGARLTTGSVMKRALDSGEAEPAQYAHEALKGTA
jgi:ribose transport system ATP-binding protein